jgi:hypothetical protein
MIRNTIYNNDYLFTYLFLSNLSFYSTHLYKLVSTS